MNSYFFRAYDELCTPCIFTPADFPLMLSEDCFTLSANEGSPVLMLGTLEQGDETGTTFRTADGFPRFKHRERLFDFRAFLGSIDGMAVIEGISGLVSVSDIQQFSGLTDSDGKLIFYGDSRADSYMKMKGGEPVWTSFLE